MSKTLPTFGEIVPGEGGRLGAIMRGTLVNGVRQPDYAVILADTEAPTLAWGEYGKRVEGADSLTDGQTNTAAMLKAGSQAAKHVAALNIDGHADWYIPARGELWALRANVPELFAKEWHWSSTQYSADLAFVQDFENGTSSWDLKVSEYRVRAVRRIQLQHSNT